MNEGGGVGVGLRGDASEDGPISANPWMPAALANASVVTWGVVNLGVATAYFVLGMIVSRFFAAYGLFPAPIWLPAGIATVSAMAGSVRVVPGIFLGALLTNALLFHPPLIVSFIISVTNAVGPVVGAMLLRRLRPDRGLFTSFAGVIAFIVCTTFLSPAISAAGGTFGMALGQPPDLTELYSRWVNWWLTDSGGTLYLAPALILWLGLEHEQDLSARHKPIFDRRDLTVWAWVATVSVVLFLTPPLRGSYIRAAFPFLLVVPLSWIALRMSLRYAYSLVTLVSIAATAGTVAGFGPFQNHGLANPLQLVGVLVVLLAMNVLTIVALVSERADAQNANRVKSMFLANTSHELRTPLNAIIGFSSLIGNLATRGVSEEKLVDYANTITASGEHLLALINDLLDMSKIEAGRFDLDEQAISLNGVVDGLIDLVRLQAEQKAIRLVFDRTTADATIKADPKAIRQILLNLLSNAVKFTETGGRVSASIQPGSGGTISVLIADTGVGIAPDALERVFQPFERAQAKTAAQTEGTGLGLSIARGLISLHGGNIVLESSVGKGTTAIVTIPANRVITIQTADKPLQATSRTAPSASG
jgi:two-component system cell cycle sensor histidine kinase PleC